MITAADKDGDTLLKGSLPSNSLAACSLIHLPNAPPEQANLTQSLVLVPPQPIYQWRLGVVAGGERTTRDPEA